LLFPPLLLLFHLLPMCAGKGHKHPVYAMSIVNNAVIHELVSISTDGTHPSFTAVLD
jgi:hypothetical protein